MVGGVPRRDVQPHLVPRHRADSAQRYRDAGRGREDTITKYQTIANTLQAGIEDGTYPEGSLLPAEKVAEEHGVSRPTVRQALEVLERAGLIEMVKGQGAFVAGGTPRKPKHETIAEALRASIADGTFPEGAALPSEQTLATRYETSRPTVRQAIAALKTDGLVHVINGRGAFVTRDADASPDALVDALHGLTDAMNRVAAALERLERE